MVKADVDSPKLLRLHCPAEPDSEIAFFANENTFERSALSACEYILHPTLVRNGKKELPAISHAYASSGHRTLVFILEDYEKTYPAYANLILFRTSLRASRKRANELVLPYLWECRENGFSVLASGTQARVGFCGQVSKERRKLIATFERSNKIASDFLKRDQFWGGNPHEKTLVQDFYQNLERNHCTVAQRGVGNFSMRFYQALAVGRIPVLVNTDMELPFQNQIAWKEAIIFEKNPRACVDRVLAVHAAGEIEHMQQRCQQISRTWFGPDRYFAHIARILRASMP